MRRVTLHLSLLLVACARDPACGSASVCRNASWHGALIADSLRSIPASVADGGGDSSSLEDRAQRIRFSLDAVPASESVTRAVLSLQADTTRAQSLPVTLRARALLGRWRPGGYDLTPRGDERAEVTIRTRARVAVRLDVTPLLREAASHGARSAELSLSADGDVRVGGPWSAVAAPRLEVASR